MDVDDMAGSHAPDRPSYWGNHYMAVPRDLVADIVEVLCEHLDAMRGQRDVEADVVDGLQALYGPIQRRRVEQAVKQRRGQAGDSAAMAGAG